MKEESLKMRFMEQLDSKRGAKGRLTQMISQICFLCSIPTFNLWTYLSFMKYLWNKHHSWAFLSLVCRNNKTQSFIIWLGITHNSDDQKWIWLNNCSWKHFPAFWPESSVKTHAEPPESCDESLYATKYSNARNKNNRAKGVEPVVITDSKIKVELVCYRVNIIFFVMRAHIHLYLHETFIAVLRLSFLR